MRSLSNPSTRLGRVAFLPDTGTLVSFGNRQKSRPAAGIGSGHLTMQISKKLASGVARLMAGDIDDGHAEAERDRDHSGPFCLPSALSIAPGAVMKSDALRIAGKRGAITSPG